MSKTKAIVTVIGGLVMDLTYKVDQWPQVHQAVQAGSYILRPGGKGLNQATAVARMGLEVQLISSVGNNSFADRIFSVLATEGIKGNQVIRQKDTPTDLIGIIVDKQGSPGFIGVKRATSKLSSKDVHSRRSLISKSDVLLVNSEVSIEAVVAALHLAKKEGVITVYNPAPPPEKLPKDILKAVDYFVPNEWEAQMIYSAKSKLSSRKLALAFHKKGAKVTIVTMGKSGGVVAANGQVKPYLAFPVDEVDETGAGDAFCGALVYALTKKWELDKSIEFAAAAGALSCTKMGAQSSMPTIKETLNFLKSTKTRIFPPF